MMNAVKIGKTLKRRRIKRTERSMRCAPRPAAQNRRSRPVRCIYVLPFGRLPRPSCIGFYARLRSVRTKLTMSGSIGSGSVPVIPFGVGDGAVVDVEEGVEVEPVTDANARSTGPANSTSSRTKGSFRTAYLNIGSLLFQRKFALGGD